MRRRLLFRCLLARMFLTLPLKMTLVSAKLALVQMAALQKLQKGIRPRPCKRLNAWPRRRVHSSASVATRPSPGTARLESKRTVDLSDREDVSVGTMCLGNSYL